MGNFTNSKSWKAVVTRTIKYCLPVASCASWQLLCVWNIQNDCTVNTQCDSHSISVKQLRTTAPHARWSTTTSCKSNLNMASQRLAWLEWPLQSPSHNSVIRVISFNGNEPKMNSTNQNQEHLMNWNKFEMLLALFLLAS